MLQLSMRRLLKHLQPLAQQQLERSVEGVLDRTALHVRVTLKDEAMPPIVRRCVDDLVSVCRSAACMLRGLSLLVSTGDSVTVHGVRRATSCNVTVV